MTRRRFVFVGLLLLWTLLGLWMSDTFAKQVNLAWDKPTTNTDGTAYTDAGGYEIHYGKASGEYDKSVRIGDVSSHTITGLTPGITYYFAVRAVDTSNNKSEFSNEVSHTFPLPPPGIGVYVYVGYDGRASNLPTWLVEDYAQEPEFTLRMAGADHHFYKSLQTFSTVAVPGNQYQAPGGASGAGSNYVLILRGTTSVDLPQEQWELGIEAGDRFYMDRSYTVSASDTLPGWFGDAILVRTDNDQKNNKAEVYITFDVEITASLTICVSGTNQDGVPIVDRCY